MNIVRFRRSKSAAAAIAALVVAGCAQTRVSPTLYPNERLRTVGSAQADADVHRCEQMASEYSSNESNYRDTLKSGAIGGAVGAGTGALAGAIMKENVGRATGAGAAVGSILGVANELRQRGEPDPSYKEFVKYCLEREGYEVAGWR